MPCLTTDPRAVLQKEIVRLCEVHADDPQLVERIQQLDHPRFAEYLGTAHFEELMIITIQRIVDKVVQDHVHFYQFTRRDEKTYCAYGYVRISDTAVHTILYELQSLDLGNEIYVQKLNPNYAAMNPFSVPDVHKLS